MSTEFSFTADDGSVVDFCAMEFFSLFTKMFCK